MAENKKGKKKNYYIKNNKIYYYGKNDLKDKESTPKKKTTTTTKKNTSNKTTPKKTTPTKKTTNNKNYYYRNGKKVYRKSTNTKKKPTPKVETKQEKELLNIPTITEEEIVKVPEEVKVIEKEPIKEIKKKKSNIIPIIIYIIFIPLLLISLYNIINWKEDSDNTVKQIEEIKDLVKVEEVIETEEKEIEIIEPIEEIPKENPYWDYINMKLINVDFTELKKKNKQTKGWIQVNGTNINYPFVQANNNDYYLTHSFDKSYNDAGWVFLDYRNNIKNLNKNTIIYAHARKDKTMFGSLRNILKSGWLKNTDNYVIKLSTETENTLWQVFSVYHIPTTADYIQVNFKDNKEFTEWANMLINRSQHNFNTTINEDDKVLTLSTCYNDTEKVVLHAKLIKKEVRK